MKSPLPALFGALLLLPPAALADRVQPNAQQEQGCGLADGAFVSQDGGQVTINCVGVSAQSGRQLAGVLTYVLQRRLDPQTVIAKLDEVDGVPADGAPRNLSIDQGQAIVQHLAADKPAVITIVADPDEPDAANYALAIATRLGMAGWQVDGKEIRRLVPPGLDGVRGLVLVVHDDKAPPKMAGELKEAMAAARVFVPVIARDSVSAGTAMLWVGKRPSLGDPAATQ